MLAKGVSSRRLLRVHTSKEGTASLLSARVEGTSREGGLPSREDRGDERVAIRGQHAVASGVAVAENSKPSRHLLDTSAIASGQPRMRATWMHPSSHVTCASASQLAKSQSVRVTGCSPVS